LNVQAASHRATLINKNKSSGRTVQVLVYEIIFQNTGSMSSDGLVLLSQLRNCCSVGMF